MVADTEGRWPDDVLVANAGTYVPGSPRRRIRTLDRMIALTSTASSVPSMPSFPA
jgi:hypothetical protein